MTVLYARCPIPPPRSVRASRFGRPPPGLSRSQKTWAASILGVMGTEIYVDDEKYLDMTTAVSGSGPAYVFLWVEAMTEAAVKLGFTPEVLRNWLCRLCWAQPICSRNPVRLPPNCAAWSLRPAAPPPKPSPSLKKAASTRLVAQAVTAAYEKAKKLGS